MPNLTEQSTANILAEKFICNIDVQLDTIFVKDFNSINLLLRLHSLLIGKVFGGTTTREFAE